MDRSNTARGRLAIFLDLVRDEHGLFSGGSQASLPGKFRNQVPDPVMSAGVDSLGTARSMPAVWVQDVWASLAPRGGATTLLSRARGQGSPGVGSYLVGRQDRGGWFQTCRASNEATPHAHDSFPGRAGASPGRLRIHWCLRVASRSARLCHKSLIVTFVANCRDVCRKLS